jgi:hypothetical protein
VLITIAEYETLLGEDLSALDEDYVEGILDCVSEDLEIWLGRSYSAAAQVIDTVQATLAHYGGLPVLQIATPRAPVQSVDALTVYLVPGSASTVDVSDAIIDAAGIVRVTFGVFNTYRNLFRQKQYQGTLTYTVGGAAVPVAIKRAVALLAQEMLHLDANSAYDAGLSGDTETFRIGDYSETKATRDLDASQGLGLGSANAVLAARLAGRYKAQGVVLV